MSNPLQKYFRQPKLYISLPSKGRFYPEGVLIGDYSNVPIFGMSGMDELIMKTPDALFSGEATIKLIESCCPYIKDASKVPSLDIDALLVAIRIATYEDTITMTAKCSGCGEENDYDIRLTEVLDHYNEKIYDDKIVVGDLTINLKPLSYEDLSKVNVENFKLQKMLSQLDSADIDEEARQKHVDDIYQKLAEIQLSVILSSIESITTPAETVSDIEFIKEWLTNTAAVSYNTIKERLEKNKKDWTLPAHDVKCAACGHEDQIEFSLDQSNFFG
jgi:hypothetical protein